MNYFFDEAGILTLVDFLESKKVELGLNEVFDNRPYRGNDMDIPCASVSLVGDSSRIPVNSRKILSSQIVGNTLTQVEEVAEYSQRLVLDIYAGYKYVRSEIFDKIARYFSDKEGSGLVVDMPKYHNAKAYYNIVSVTYPDSPEDEWRVNVTIECEYPEIVVTNYNRIDTLELRSSIGNNSNQEASSEEIKEIN